jgi:3'-5' exoribonuclease
MTPEALLVHYADDIDAKFAMAAEILRDDSPGKPMTGKQNYLRQKFYRGPG